MKPSETITRMACAIVEIFARSVSDIPAASQVQEVKLFSALSLVLINIHTTKCRTLELTHAALFHPTFAGPMILIRIRLRSGDCAPGPDGQNVSSTIPCATYRQTPAPLFRRQTFAEHL